MPTCPKCHTPESLFYHNTRECIPCVKARYRTGKARELDAKMKRETCADCDLAVTPETHLAFEWDHREQCHKKFSVSQMATCSNETFYKEIEKCDLVCVLHHRLRSIRRLHSGETTFKSPRGRPRKSQEDQVRLGDVNLHSLPVPSLAAKNLS